MNQNGRRKMKLIRPSRFSDEQLRQIAKENAKTEKEKEREKKERAKKLAKREAFEKNVVSKSDKYFKMSARPEGYFSYTDICKAKRENDYWEQVGIAATAYGDKFPIYLPANGVFPVKKVKDD